MIVIICLGKAGYLYTLPEAPGLTSMVLALMKVERLQMKPALDELPAKPLEGGLGLVWDGVNSET